MSAEACEGTPVRGLEHINAITVPVFSIASAGDNPDKYDYTFTLIQSSDKTYLRVQLLSDEEQAFDFGHAEFFTAGDAETLVWYPMLDWINAH
jgi:hypothetical protein